MEGYRIYHCQACRRHSPFSIVILAPIGEVFAHGKPLLELCREDFDKDMWLDTESE